MPDEVQRHESALIVEMSKLTVAVKKSNSLWRALVKGILISIGTMIGIIVLTVISGFFLWRAAQGVDWQEAIQGAVLNSFRGDNQEQPKNQNQRPPGRTSNSFELTPEQQNMLDQFLNR